MIAYTVTAHFTNIQVAQEWMAWLRDGHLAQVLAGGAMSATVVRMDDSVAGQIRCEVRYHFADRESFAKYERDHAPGLRADGLKRFGPERGIRYERSLGEVVCSLPG